MWGTVTPRRGFAAAWVFGCLAVLILSFVVLSPAQLAAHERHDLDPALAEAADVPRLVGQSDHFEFVVIPSPDGLSVLVDRLDSNEPATGLAVRVATDGRTLDAKESSPGVYAVAAQDAAARSRQITVTVGSERGEEQFAGALAAGVAAPERARPAGAFGAWLRGAAFAALGFGIALAVFRTGRSRWGGALLVALALAWLLAQPSDRRELPSVAARAAPHRHQDGSVFLAKSAQRLLDVRTMRAQESREAPGTELFGRVIPNPSASAHVQAMRDGRIEPGPQGLPHIGQSVAPGQVLAYLVPVLTAFEESSLRQSLTQVERDMAMLVPRADAIGPVNPTMPMSDSAAGLLQELQIQSQALTRQKDTIQAALNQRLEIKAPAAGVVASASIAIGQSVAARELLFEIVDPKSIWVEAWSFEAGDDGTGATALTSDGRRVALDFIGRGPTLQQQAAVLLFGVNGEAGPAIGTPVRVFAKRSSELTGVVVPADAVVRGPANLPTVWEHAGPEVFVPHLVRVTPLDAGRVLVAGEVGQGMRLVTGGAAFDNPVR